MTERGVTEADLARFLATGGQVQEKVRPHSTHKDRTYFSREGVKVRSWREAQRLIDEYESNLKGAPPDEGPPVAAAATAQPGGTPVMATAHELAPTAAEAAPWAAEVQGASKRRGRPLVAQPSSSTPPLCDVMPPPTASVKERAEPLPPPPPPPPPEEVAADSDEDQGAEAEEEEEEEDEEALPDGPRHRRPNPRYFGVGGVATQAGGGAQGDVPAARGLSTLSEWGAGEAEEADEADEAEEEDEARVRERVLIAPGGGFVIVTKGGRTLHHRAGCQCKPCLARRRSMDDGAPTAVEWDAAARPESAEPAEPRGRPHFPAPGGGPGRGNKLCNGCGAVVRNGLRECPHCAFLFLPVRPRELDDSAGGGLAVMGRKRSFGDVDAMHRTEGAARPAGGSQRQPGAAPMWGTHALRRSAHFGAGGVAAAAAITPAPALAAQQPPSFAAPASGPLELWVRLSGGEPDWEVVRWSGARTLVSLERCVREALAAELPAGAPLRYLRWLDNDSRGCNRGATKLRSDTDIMSLRVLDRIEAVPADRITA